MTYLERRFADRWRQQSGVRHVKSEERPESLEQALDRIRRAGRPRRGPRGSGRASPRHPSSFCFAWVVRERIAKGNWADGIGRSPRDTPTSETPGVDGGGLAQQLKELAELHQAGVLSDEEFTQAKQKLLG